MISNTTGSSNANSTTVEKKKIRKADLEKEIKKLRKKVKEVEKAYSLKIDELTSLLRNQDAASKRIINLLQDVLGTYESQRGISSKLLYLDLLRSKGGLSEKERELRLKLYKEVCSYFTDGFGEDVFEEEVAKKLQPAEPTKTEPVTAKES